MGWSCAEDLVARQATLRAAVAAAEGDLAAADAEVSTANQTLIETVVRSPIDGTVVTKPLLAGAVVSHETTLARIAD